MKRVLLLAALLWLTAGILPGAQASNLSCNYASSGAANTQCVITGEKWVGIKSISVGGCNGNTTNITYDNDGNALSTYPDNISGYHCVDVAESRGGGYQSCKMISGTMTIPIAYFCSGVGDCRYGRHEVTMNLSAPEMSIGSTRSAARSYTRQWSGSAGACTQTITPPYSSNGRLANGCKYDGAVRSTFNCTMNIPVGTTFLNTYYYPATSPVTSYDLSGSTFNKISFLENALPVGQHFEYNYNISLPQASCNSPAVSSYVFWATGTTDYTLHSRYKNDSVMVQLRPQQNISSCTHNVYSWAGVDGWNRTTAKLAIKSESSSCDKSVTNSYSTWQDGADTVINWTISGLSTLAGGTQVNCTHNLVTELTWY